MTQHELDEYFMYHPPTSEQIPRYHAIREAGKAFAEAIMAYSPSGADQTAAIRKVREAVMTANQSIACEVKA